MVRGVGEGKCGVVWGVFVCPKQRLMAPWKLLIYGVTGGGGGGGGKKDGGRAQHG